MTEHFDAEYDDLIVGLPSDEVDLLNAKEKESPLSHLKTIIFDIDKQLTEENLLALNDEVHSLRDLWAGEKVYLVYLQVLEYLSKYIYQKKSAAHPDAVKLLPLFCNNLDSIVMGTNDVDSKVILKKDIERFEKLKQDSADYKPQELEQDDEKSLIRLKDLILPINERTNGIDLEKARTEVLRLEDIFRENRPAIILLQGIETLITYIQSEAGDANVSSFALVHDFYNSLEKIVSGELSAAKAKELLLVNVNKFNSFKNDIASEEDSELDKPIDSTPASEPALLVDSNEEAGKEEDDLVAQLDETDDEDSALDALFADPSFLEDNFSDTLDSVDVETSGDDEEFLSNLLDEDLTGQAGLAETEAMDVDDESDGFSPELFHHEADAIGDAPEDIEGTQELDDDFADLLADTFDDSLGDAVEESPLAIDDDVMPDAQLTKVETPEAEDDSGFDVSLNFLGDEILEDLSSVSFEEDTGESVLPSTDSGDSVSSFVDLTSDDDADQNDSDADFDITSDDDSSISSFLDLSFDEDPEDLVGEESSDVENIDADDSSIAGFLDLSYDDSTESDLEPNLDLGKISDEDVAIPSFLDLSFDDDSDKQEEESDPASGLISDLNMEDMVNVSPDDMASEDDFLVVEDEKDDELEVPIEASDLDEVDDDELLSSSLFDDILADDFSPALFEVADVQPEEEVISTSLTEDTGQIESKLEAVGDNEVDTPRELANSNEPVSLEADIGILLDIPQDVEEPDSEIEVETFLSLIDDDGEDDQSSSLDSELVTKVDEAEHSVEESRGALDSSINLLADDLTDNLGVDDLSSENEIVEFLEVDDDDAPVLSEVIAALDEEKELNSLVDVDSVLPHISVVASDDNVESVADLQNSEVLAEKDESSLVTPTEISLADEAEQSVEESSGALDSSINLLGHDLTDNLGVDDLSSENEIVEFLEVDDDDATVLSEIVATLDEEKELNSLVDVDSVLPHSSVVASDDDVESVADLQNSEVLAAKDESSLVIPTEVSLADEAEQSVEERSDDLDSSIDLLGHDLTDNLGADGLSSEDEIVEFLEVDDDDAPVLSEIIAALDEEKELNSLVDVDSALPHSSVVASDDDVEPVANLQNSEVLAEKDESSLVIPTEVSLAGEAEQSVGERSYDLDSSIDLLGHDLTDNLGADGLSSEEEIVEFLEVDSDKDDDDLVTFLPVDDAGEDNSPDTLEVQNNEFTSSYEGVDSNLTPKISEPTSNSVETESREDLISALKISADTLSHIYSDESASGLLSDLATLKGDPTVDTSMQFFLQLMTPLVTHIHQYGNDANVEAFALLSKLVQAMGCDKEDIPEVLLSWTTEVLEWQQFMLASNFNSPRIIEPVEEAPDNAPSSAEAEVDLSCEADEAGEALNEVTELDSLRIEVQELRDIIKGEIARLRSELIAK